MNQNLGQKNGYTRLAEKIPLNTPLSLLIEPTNRCNFRCIFCPTGDREHLREVGRPSGDMSLELFRKIVSDIQSFPDKLKRISLYKDGEPLLHPDLPEMIKILKDADVCNDVSTTSNAALLTEELAAKLIESGLDSIRFSVVSMSDEGYKKLTRTTCDYETVRENIKIRYRVRHDLLDRSNPIIYIKIVDFDFNLSEEERQKFCEDFSIISDQMSIDAPMNWDGSHRRDLTLGKKKYIDMDEETSLQQRQVCPRPWYTMTINFNGLVSVCVLIGLTKQS